MNYAQVITHGMDVGIERASPSDEDLGRTHLGIP